MQNVSFESVEELLDFLPDDELKITEYLRAVILECIPEATEKLSFNVPFYSCNRSICFIWPASVLWGKKKTYEGVRLGFAQGHLLTDEAGYLQKGKRKQVYWKDFTGLKEIDSDVIRTFLFEAVLIDRQFGKKTGAKKKKPLKGGLDLIRNKKL